MLRDEPLLAGEVYIVGVLEGCHKIGHSVDPSGRLATYAPLLPVELTVVHTIRSENRMWLESLLHEAFAHKRVRGEWFRLTDSDLRLLGTIAAASQLSDLPPEIADLFANRTVTQPQAKPERQASKKTVVAAEFGATVRRARIGVQLSQRELAKQVGISQPYMTDIEGGVRTPSEQLLGKLATMLGIKKRSLVLLLPEGHRARLLAEFHLPMLGNESVEVDMRDVIPRESALYSMMGDDYRDLGINHGDHLAVIGGRTLQDDDLVVVETENGRLLKTYFEGQLWECRNCDRTEPIPLDGKGELKVVGVVVVVFGDRRLPQE